MNELSTVKKNYIQYIDNIIKNNKLSHAYLIEVDDYDDSFDYILSFVKMIICNISYEDTKKLSLDEFHLIDNGNYPDLTIVSSDTSVINKMLITNLQKEFNNKSSFDNKKIYIIKEAEKFNPSSANTILKFLEEPEEDIIAILLTNDRYHIIDTILSRCQILTLKEVHTFDIEDDSIIDLLDCILNPNSFFISYNHFSKEVLNDKDTLIKKMHIIERILLSFLSGDGVIKKDSSFYILLSKYDINHLINILDIIEEEIPKLSFNVNYKLWMDSFFARLIGGFIND